MVSRYLANPTDAEWKTLRRDYLELLDRRLKQNREPFDELAALASDRDVYLGCNCPTKANPRVDRCHTVLALQFMKERFPELRVVFPA
jgi:hypothetical protein